MHPMFRLAFAASLATSAPAQSATPREKADETQPPPRSLVAIERQYYPIVEEFEGGRPVRYTCENGKSFAVRFDRVRGASTAQVRYADGLANEARRTLLLVGGPTGSGVRFTNDAAVLHLKGAEARIEIPETAGNDAYAASQCVREAEVGESPRTQGALAGNYFFAIDRFYPGQYDKAHFAKAEVICFIASDADFLALVPARGEIPARYYVSHGNDLVETGPMLVGELDAGVGKRSYPIDLGYPGFLTMHFAAPGSIDGTVRGMAGLSSIDGAESGRLDCLDSGNYLYVGLFDDRTVTVELTEEGSLVYRETMKGNSAPPVAIHGGRIAFDDGRTTFHFFDDEGALLQVIGSADGDVPPNAYLVNGSTRRLEQQARAYFVADADTWQGRMEAFPTRFSNLLLNLDICNHLAGEGGEEQRTREVGSAQHEYGCALLELDYDRALAEFPDDSKMLEYLTANALIWR